MIIETTRLFLSSPEHVDADQIAEYVNRNKEFLMRFEPVRPVEYYTASGQEKILVLQMESWQKGESCRFYISPKSRRESVIGFAALNGISMGAFCSCYLSYQLDQAFQNQGLMTEAVDAVVKYAFSTLHLHRIESNIMPGNIPSIRVAEKCGFVKEGLARKYLKINGVWEDHLHYVVWNEELERE